jgi:hypothetical protein
MIQSDAILDRAAGLPQRDDEDALFDSWLASMGTREFELILNGLAALDVSAPLEATA